MRVTLRKDIFDDEGYIVGLKGSEIDVEETEINGYIGYAYRFCPGKIYILTESEVEKIKGGKRNAGIQNKPIPTGETRRSK
jgi:hypothetical protein